jgi:hypothetical protein
MEEKQRKSLSRRQCGGKATLQDEKSEESGVMERQYGGKATQVVIRREKCERWEGN